MMQFDEEMPLVNTGAWGDFGGSRFLISHISNDKFQRALARLQQPYRRKIEQGNLDPVINKKIVAQAMSEGLLLDWDKVVDHAKAPVEYSPPRGLTMLMKNVEFRDFVTEFATNLNNFREEEVEELGKSSSIG